MTKREPLKVAVAGLGHLHPRLYMPLFAANPDTEVTACFDPDDALRGAFSHDFGIRAYGALDRMLGEEELDAAAVFLPHADCPAAAEACAEAGLHLMVEKPMAASADGAQRMVDAAAARGRVLTTGYCWRLHPVAAEFRRLVGSGVLGRLVGAEGRCAAGRLTRYIEGHSAWMLRRDRSGGGPMYNLGVHWIDLFRWIFGAEVVEVSGHNVRVNETYDIEDNSFAHLAFDNGLVAALDISYTVPDAYPYGRDLFLAARGTSGAVSWAPAYEGQKDELFVCSDHPAFGGSPRRRQVFELEPVAGYSGVMGRDYVRAFVSAVHGEAELPVTGADGVAALRVVEAIYRSARERRWVKV